jgi:hypothetical protein
MTVRSTSATSSIAVVPATPSRQPNEFGVPPSGRIRATPPPTRTWEEIAQGFAQWQRPNPRDYSQGLMGTSPALSLVPLGDFVRDLLNQNDGSPPDGSELNTSADISSASPTDSDVLSSARTVETICNVARPLFSSPISPERTPPVVQQDVKNSTVGQVDSTQSV